MCALRQHSYGMNNDAQSSLTRILSNKQYSQRTRDIAALYSAKIYYKQGVLAKANNILSSMGDTLSSHLKKEKDLLLANVLIDKNQLFEAERILPRLDGDGEVDTLSWYGQHNLGVAMLKNGQPQKGIDILRKVSAESFQGNERRALQDKANLALGYAYLQAGDMHSAIGYFEKIRINGPFSFRALLGLGFAEATLGRYQRALIPWFELQKGDIRESEVQEALLMIPETLFKLESYKKSQANYQNAASLYKLEIDALSAAIEATRAGKITKSILAKGVLKENQWNDFLMQPSDLPEARYFPWYMRDEEFRQAVSLYKEALDLRNVLASQKETLSDYGLSHVVAARYAGKISVKIAEVDDTLIKIDGYIKSLASTWLENRKASLNDYLSQASLGSANVYRHAAERGDQ